jgi:hypothetical protein
MKVTKTKPPGYSDQTRALKVSHGSIGRGHAGKTVLLRAARRRTLQRGLPSGLSFDLDDPRKTVDLLKEYRSTRELLERRGLPATQEAEESAIELYAGDRRLAVLQSREAVGQVYAHTTTGASAEQQERFRQHVDYLAQASVLWVVLSVPAEGSTRRALSRYEDDLLVMRAYLRESLRLRRPERTCAVGIVITKLDTLFESDDEARRRWTDDEVMKTVAPLVSVLEESDKVAWAIINPVSAFGFGNAELLDPADADARPEPDESEPEWVLRRDVGVEPYNVVPLIVWSFLAGMLNQEVSPEEGDVLAKVCRLLRADLAALDGWQIPVKGPT